MRVEIKIEQELAEPYAVLHVPKLTAEVSAIAESLEGVSDASDVLAAKKDGKAYVIEAEQVELIRTGNENALIKLWLSKRTGTHEIECRLYAISAVRRVFTHYDIMRSLP